jgi:predicted nucleotidyltransferase
LSLLEAVVAVLRERRVPHAVIGATALAFHRVSRATGDLDLFAVHVSCLDRDTWRLVAEEGYAVDVRSGDESDPLAGVVRFEGRRGAGGSRPG